MVKRDGLTTFWSKPIPFVVEEYIDTHSGRIASTPPIGDTSPL